MKRYVFAPPPALKGAGTHMDIPFDHPAATPPVAGTPHSEEAGTPKDTYAKAPAAADMVAGAGTTKKGKKVKKGKVLDTDPGGGAPSPKPRDIAWIMTEVGCSRQVAVEALARCQCVEAALCLASAIIALGA